MVDPFIGSEAIAAGTLTRHALRRDFVALHQDVYVAKGVDITPLIARDGSVAPLPATWNSRRLLGCRLARRTMDRPESPRLDHRYQSQAHQGVEAWADAIDDDEVWLIRGMAVTSPARTALDIASRYPEGPAVASVDALARATDLKLADVEILAERYKGRRGIRAARAALELVDPGAESLAKPG